MDILKNLYYGIASQDNGSYFMYSANDKAYMAKHHSVMYKYNCLSLTRKMLSEIEHLPQIIDYAGEQPHQPLKIIKWQEILGEVI